MLLVFSDDWGRHPSSCQHLVSQLLRRHRVTWVNTIGMRPPRLNWATVRRGWEKITQWSSTRSAASEAPSNPLVLNPRMWPWFKRGTDRWLNRQLLTRALRKVISDADEPVHAVTTIPIVADLMGKLFVESWTYYCVDDFSLWPGLDQATMLRMERNVIARSDRLLAVSENLADRLTSAGKNCELLTHGVDLDFWRSSSTEPSIAAIAELPGPIIVFWGVIDRRMNVSWIKQLSQDLEHGTILLVGPLDDPEPELLALPRVVHASALPFAQLPALGQRADLLIMPYADLPVTRAMQPLKLKEYMATGKAVVASDLPATREWAGAIDIAHTAAEFSQLARQRLATGVTGDQLLQRRRLEFESWSAKAAQFECAVTGRQIVPTKVTPAVVG